MGLGVGWSRFGPAGVGLASLLLGPSFARAQPPLGEPMEAEEPRPGDLAGRRRVFFDVEAAYWQGTFGRRASDGNLVIRSESFGFLGYRRVPLGFGLAFAPSERWVIGARIDLAVEPFEHDGTSAVTVRGGIGPFAEVTFKRDRHVRPFALVRAGIGRSGTFVRRGRAVELEGLEAPTLTPTAGLGLGTHVFLTDEVSFDAMLTADYRWNLARVDPRTDGELTESGIRTEGWRVRDGTVGTGIAIGFSHWW